MPIMNLSYSLRWLLPALLLSACFYLSMVRPVQPPAPLRPYLNGVFSSETPGEVGQYDVSDVFPGIGFQGPVRLLPFPDTARGLVVLGKRGQAWLANPTTRESRQIMDISDRVLNGWEGGSLGIAFHPDFAKGGKHEVFVFYRWKENVADYTEEGYNRVSRFQWDEAGQRIDAASEEVLIQQYDRRSWHAGGDMFFGPDGFLYIALGDEGLDEDDWPASNQRLDRGLFAGILRIDIDNDPQRSHPIRRQPQPPVAPPEGWPPTFSAGYMIPNDNPWLDPAGTLLEEFVVLGTRSPHAISWDAQTEQIWIADVGLSAFEEINRAVSGDNLQWPFLEGDRRPGSFKEPETVTGRQVPPYVAYTHQIGNCILGGGVYRHRRHPSLDDHYLFVDYGVNSLMAVPASGGDRQIRTLIGDLTSLPHRFPESAKLSGVYPQSNGDILLTVMGKRRGESPGKIYRLVQKEIVGDPPARLSELGVFTDLKSLTAAPGILPYRTNAELYSDGARKRRWMAVPNRGVDGEDVPGMGIEFRADAPWTFPEGTVFIKHFEMPGAGPDGTNLPLETRFFVLGARAKGYGLSYRWNEAGTDAYLLKSGDERPYQRFSRSGRSLGQGVWSYPSRTQCLSCHTGTADYVLGVQTHQLNARLTYPATGQTLNQLDYLSQSGVLRGMTGPVSDLPRARALDDETASLDLRVRSYLDANCASCHRAGGMENVRMDLRFGVTDSLQRGIVGLPTRSHASNPSYNIVEPGNHAISELWLRDASEHENQMPPLGRSRRDEVWVARLAEWIDGLGRPEVSPGEVVVYPNPATDRVGVQLPADWAPPFQVTVYDAAGRRLTQLVGGVAELHEFVLPLTGYPAGLLLVTVRDARGRRGQGKVVVRR